MDDEASPSHDSESEPTLDAASHDQGADIALARDLVIRAHPQAVQELITGNSLADLLASVPIAEAAFSRVADAAREEATRASAAAVPGGGGVRSADVNVEGLGPLAKIRAGLNRS